MKLLLGTDLVAVTALALAAVVGLEGKTSIAATADHLLAVVLTSKGDGRGFKCHFDNKKNNKTEKKYKQKKSRLKKKKREKVMEM